MRLSRYAWMVAVGAAVAFGPAVRTGLVPAARADQPAGAAKEKVSSPSPTPGALHGGIVFKTEDHLFETVYDPKDIRVYAYTLAKEPIVLGDVRGTVRVEFKHGMAKVVDMLLGDPDTGEPATYFCPMHPEVVQDKPGECSKCGLTLKLQNRLLARADFSKVEPDSMRMTFRISGLDGKEPEATYTDIYMPPPPGHGATTRATGRKSAAAKHSPAQGSQPPGTGTVK